MTKYVIKTIWGEKEKIIVSKCLDLWDLIYEKNIGVTRTLSKELMDRQQLKTLI